MMISLMVSEGLELDVKLKNSVEDDRTRRLSFYGTAGELEGIEADVPEICRHFGGCVEGRIEKVLD